MQPTGPVTFPSGEVVDLGDSSNICLNCHQGRASKVTIDNKIAGGSPPYSFSNAHYFPVGAVLFGTDTKGGYEFAGKTYTGQRIWPNHLGQFGTCVECHMGKNSPRKIVAVNNFQSPRPAANSNTTSSVPEKYHWLIFSNPMTAIIETFRYGFLGSGALNITTLSCSAAVSLFILVIGTIIFNRVEKTFMDTV